MLPAAVKPPADDSMTAVLLDPLNTLQSLTQALFLSLSSIQARPSPLPTIQSLVQADTNLAAAVELARTHQAKQCRIETLKDEVLHLDEIWKTICAQLETGRCELESVIEEGEERIKAIEQAKQGPHIYYPVSSTRSNFFQHRYPIQNYWRMRKA
jgi:mediator of RNA polymerase II transcription subunit 4